jgi:hypothetical protein
VAQANSIGPGPALISMGPGIFSVNLLFSDIGARPQDKWLEQYLIFRNFLSKIGPFLDLPQSSGIVPLVLVARH